MFNSKIQQFAWKEFSVMVDGFPLITIQDAEYTTDKDIEEIYGAGDDPQFLAEGNKKYSGSIEVLQSDYETLVATAKTRGLDDVTDLEVDLLFSFIPQNATQLNKTVVDRASGVKFTKSGKKISQGKGAKISLPWKCLKIKNQI